MERSSAEIWSTTAINALVVLLIGAGWLMGRADTAVAVPSLLACAHIELRNQAKRTHAVSAAPIAIFAAAQLVQGLL